MYCSWQQLMNCFDPIALSVGSFTISWYAIFFLLAWVGAYGAMSYFEKQKALSERLTQEQIENLFWWLLWQLLFVYH